MTERNIPIVGPGFTLPSNAQLIIVRAPADTDPSVFEGLKLSDLMEDEQSITKQMSIVYYKDEESGFVQALPNRSFTLVHRENSNEAKSAPKVVRLERPAMIPPTGLKVSRLPFQAIKTTKNPTEGKKASKKRKPSEDEEATTASPKKKKTKSSSGK